MSGNLMIFSGKSRLLTLRDQHRIGDEIVDPRCSHRPRVTKPLHLNGRGPRNQHARPVSRRPSLQINDDIDIPVGDELRGLRIRQIVDRIQGVKRLPKPLTIPVLLGRWRGIVEAHDLELLAIVLLDDVCEDISNRVIAEVV